MRFRAQVDLYLPGDRYVSAGEEFDAPGGWRPPTNAVAPLDREAVAAYWSVGPRGMNTAQPFLNVSMGGQRWTGQHVPPPSTQWIKVGHGWVLSGDGSGLGPSPTCDECGPWRDI